MYIKILRFIPKENKKIKIMSILRHTGEFISFFDHDKNLDHK